MKTKKIINKILKPYRTIIKDITGNYTDIRISMGEKFCCYCRDIYDLEIEVPFIEDELGAKFFYEKMQKRLVEYNIKENFSSEILSFLHEVGHIYTYNKWNDKLYIIQATLIPKIQATFFSNSKFFTRLCFQWYFNLALERNADKWAMNYIKNHTKQVKKWEKMLQKNYQKIFEKVLD